MMKWVDYLRLASLNLQLRKPERDVSDSPVSKQPKRRWAISPHLRFTPRAFASSSLLKKTTKKQKIIFLGKKRH